MGDGAPGFDDDPPLTHGLKVGLGTISVLALWDKILDIDFSALDIDAAVAKWPTADEQEAIVRKSFTGAMLEPSVKQTMAKYIDADALRARLAIVKEKWPEIQQRCRSQVMPAVDVESILKQVGAVYHPGQIGLTEQRFHDTYYRARLIRSRYTLLDFLFETGVLHDEVEKLFAPGGFWAERPWGGQKYWNE